MTENNLKRKYTKEFKDSILKRLDQPSNESVSDLSKELNISKSTIYQWMDDVNKDPDSWYLQDYIYPIWSDRFSKEELIDREIELLEFKIERFIEDGEAVSSDYSFINTLIELVKMKAKRAQR